MAPPWALRRLGLALASAAAAGGAYAGAPEAGALGASAAGGGGAAVAPRDIVWNDAALRVSTRQRSGARKGERAFSLLEDKALGIHLGLAARAGCHKRRLGSPSDGGWTACVERDSADGPERFVGSKGEPCLVYSIGIRKDWTFDLAAAAAGCEVHSFDPTIGLDPAGRPRGVNVTFHPWGLGAVDGEALKVAEFAEAAGGAGRLYTFDTLRRKLGHSKRRVSLLKMDIEAQEWGVFAQLAESGAAQDLGQILVELHFWGAACIRKMDAWFHSTDAKCGGGQPGCIHWRRACLGSPPSPSEIEAWRSTLARLRYDFGLVVASVRANKFSNVFLNTSIPPPSTSTPLPPDLEARFGSVADRDVLCCYEATFVQRNPQRDAAPDANPPY
ncbi:methyltransferase domain-containing protein [Pelagophyceae sp. CCMP2097]|nr:methyltransferase domain-containing protein [Pelagophyceae sp. CCMP2097]